MQEEDKSAAQSASPEDTAERLEPVEHADEMAVKLREAEQKIADLQDAFLRARAETDNIQRRSQDDIARAHKFAIEGFAQSLLNVKDSLEMVFKLETLTVESLQEGVAVTLRQLNAVFEKNKVTEIDPAVGDKLDPMIHQALSAVPSDQEPNTIVSVVQKGYLLADRLLRPAIVIVASAQAA